MRRAAVLLAVCALAAAGAMRATWGQDPFDDPRTLAELRQLEEQVEQVTVKVRPAVVLLRAANGGGTGTGVIIRPDGLVATCGHVGMRPGRRITAVLADGTELTGRTLGQVNGPRIDCGLIQLDAGDRQLPSAPLGTTERLERGDWVVTLGYTQGPPDQPRPALARVGRVLRVSEEELLTDAAIDAGDSGGPAVNLQGEVLGLNSRCGKQPWENAATPINQLRSRMADLEKQTEAPPGERRRGRRPTDEDRRGAGTRFPSGASDDTRLGVQRLANLKPAVKDARMALLRVMVDGREVAYATAVDERGLAVTKASLLPAGAAVSIHTPDLKLHDAQVLAVDRESDVALLKVTEVEPGQIAAVKWAADAKLVPGTLLLTPRTLGDGPALGFLAIEVRESERDWSSTPYLGVRTVSAAPEELEAAEADAGVTIEQVVAETPAARAGLKAGQLLLAVNGTPLSGADALRRVLSKMKVGDDVTLTLVDGAERKTVKTTLAPRTSRPGQPVRGNTVTPVSGVSAGLGQVIAHDAIVEPAQCGGPVVDLDGRVVGMNIARYDRTATHAIPAARMEQLVESLRQKAISAASAPAPKALESAPPSAAQ